MTDPQLESAHTDALLDLEAEIPTSEKLKEIIIAMGTMQEWISDILDGKEPSDFALSYPLVRQVWELQKFWNDVYKEGD